MQNLPNLYWHRFRVEAPHSADLRLTPLFPHSLRRSAEMLSLKELSVVFSVWGRGRPIKSLTPRSIHSHCVVVLTSAWKGMFTVGHTHVYILLGLKCALSVKVITAFYCFTAKWLALNRIPFAFFLFIYYQSMRSPHATHPLSMLKEHIHLNKSLSLLSFQDFYLLVSASPIIIQRHVMI